MLGVPVIDRHPVDLCPEVARHLTREIARKGAKVGELRSVVGRDDEAEMVPVALASLGEAARVRPSPVASNILPGAPSRVTPSRRR